MRISKTPNATPKSDPRNAGSRGEADGEAGDEQRIWRSLAPRLIHPARREIIEALLGIGAPMTVEDLTPVVPSAGENADLIRYHLRAMEDAGVLDAAALQVTAGKEVPCFFFTPPSSAPRD